MLIFHNFNFPYSSLLTASNSSMEGSDDLNCSGSRLDKDLFESLLNIATLYVPTSVHQPRFSVGELLLD